MTGEAQKYIKGGNKCLAESTSSAKALGWTEAGGFEELESWGQSTGLRDGQEVQSGEPGQPRGGVTVRYSNCSGKPLEGLSKGIV